MIGNTPLLIIQFTYRGEKRTLFAKAENLNMTGSIKDRMAFHIIKRAYSQGLLNPGDAIIEATSGNTGIAFSAIGRALGHPVIIYMPDWMSMERINLIRSLGAQINLVTREEGGFLGSISQAEARADEIEGAFLPRQFSNEDNSRAHYETTGPEIWWQLRFHGLFPEAFVAGVGTGGTIMGTGNYLRDMKSDIKLHPLEPSNSPTLSTGCKVGKHRIQGICQAHNPRPKGYFLPLQSNRIAGTIPALVMMLHHGHERHQSLLPPQDPSADDRVLFYAVVLLVRQALTLADNGICNTHYPNVVHQSRFDQRGLFLARQSHLLCDSASVDGNLG